MQWESSLACSGLHFGYLVGVPENVKQLFSLSLSQLVCMLVCSITLMHQFYLEHMQHACMCMLHMPNVMSLGFAYNANHIIMMSLAFAFHSYHVGTRCHNVIGVCIA